MEELIGFVASNHKSSKILNLLSSKGAMDSKAIAKTIRIVKIDKEIEELVKKELIKEIDGKYTLTELGTTVGHKLRGI